MLRFGRYRLMLLGIALIALGAVIDIGEGVWVLIVAGWGLIVYTTVRRRR